MATNIVVLGSTGSIGTQTLEVVREFPKSLKVVGLAAGENIKLLEKQIKEFSPQIVSVKKEGDALILKKKFRKLKIFFSDEGNVKVATHPKAQKVVIATPGLAGIKPTLATIKHKKTICLATKEVLVAAGKIVTEEAKKHKVKILPIDSEHSAIFQSLGDRKPREIKRIILTCSGGPFRGKKPGELKTITPVQALNHPNWKMGKKITIDCATLANKGFEVIEAFWLFNVPLEKIKVVVHPQSIVHSAVEFVDGSIIAQMGPSDMRLPIQYVLLYPGKRRANSFRRFSFSDFKSLTFEEPDQKTFRCLKLAFEAAQKGKTAPAVLTAANDIAVQAFLENRLRFDRIPNVIEKTLEGHTAKSPVTIEKILEADSWARNYAQNVVKKYQNLD